MVMLLGSWVVVVTAPRHPYVSPVEYDPIDFNLNNWTPEHLRRTMRFTKEEISLLISYLDLESIVYCQRIRPSPEFALCLQLFPNPKTWPFVIHCELDNVVAAPEKHECDEDFLLKNVQAEVNVFTK